MMQNHVAFWAEKASALEWNKPFSLALTGGFPHPRWFEDGILNATDSCLLRHVNGPRRHKAAIIWEAENGKTTTLTYLQLHQKVCHFAGMLHQYGVQTGDRVAIYMPLTPEAVVAMLACAYIGAIHTVIFGGFSASALKDRINDAACVAVITADGGFRKGDLIPLKENVDQALQDASCPSVKRVFVHQHSQQPVSMQPIDVWVHEALQECEPLTSSTPVKSNHPLFILYTSGTTGKPKGIVHSTGGYLTQVSHTMQAVLDVKDTDILWCTADIGWITGHSYVVYGPLANGATIFLYEGAPLSPHPARYWEMIDRHQISILYTAPTAIRTFMRLGEQLVHPYQLSSLRLLGSVGEPINPEAWRWYDRVIGKHRCPIVDTWWQTETGAMMIAPLPSSTSTPPGSATTPLMGIKANVVRQDGTTCQPREKGFLVIEEPWPSMALGIYNEHARFQDTYFSQLPNLYFTGDGAFYDEHGHFWIIGRIDDVINVSGHRIGTMEIESALVAHPAVAEAAVVAKPDAITGHAIVAFVTLKDSHVLTQTTQTELVAKVASEIGSFAKPSQLRFTKALPKTRSGKIMRRLLRELAANGHITGDTTTLEDFSVVAALHQEED